MHTDTYLYSRRMNKQEGLRSIGSRSNFSSPRAACLEIPLRTTVWTPDGSQMGETAADMKEEGDRDADEDGEAAEGGTDRWTQRGGQQERGDKTRQWKCDRNKVPKRRGKRRGGEERRRGEEPPVVREKLKREDGPEWEETER